MNGSETPGNAREPTARFGDPHPHSRILKSYALRTALAEDETGTTACDRAFGAL